MAIIEDIRSSLDVPATGTLTVDQLTPVIGAEIGGVDLGTPIDRAVRDRAVPGERHAVIACAGLRNDRSGGRRITRRRRRRRRALFRSEPQPATSSLRA